MKNQTNQKNKQKFLKFLFDGDFLLIFHRNQNYSGYKETTTMNKAQLIEKIATETKVSKAQTEMIFDCAVDTIKKSVKKGDDVKLVGFGTFTKAKRKARMGRNPQTGKAIKIPAAWAPKFRAGAEFKSLVK
ncbi:MAG: HU family DNA-binding protein [Pseudobdellovibrionaceae bacterium]